MHLKKYLILLILICIFFSCKKSETSNNIKKIRKFESTTQTHKYIEASWNSDGTLKSLDMNYDNGFTAIYNYGNNKIMKAYRQMNNMPTTKDTLLFFYNTDARVDSIYNNKNAVSIKFIYTSGKLSQYKYYSGAEIYFYYDLITDSKNNIIKAVRWETSTSGFTLATTDEFTYDNSKNPFIELAPYMLYGTVGTPKMLKYFGANNCTQRKMIFASPTGPIEYISGNIYQYDSNNYPSNTSTTNSSGVSTEDFTFSYN